MNCVCHLLLSTIVLSIQQGDNVQAAAEAAAGVTLQVTPRFIPRAEEKKENMRRGEKIPRSINRVVLEAQTLIIVGLVTH